jgi:hypothetical protein
MIPLIHFILGKAVEAALRRIYLIIKPLMFDSGKLDPIFSFNRRTQPNRTSYRYLIPDTRFRGHPPIHSAASEGVRMAVKRFHSKNREVYHTDRKCGAGAEIPQSDRISGSGGHRQCKNCKKLDKG